MKTRMRSSLRSLCALCVSAVNLALAAATDFGPVAKEAARAREANRAPEALRLYRRAVQIRPDFAEGWWHIGSLLYQQDQYAEAAPAFARFLKLDPKSGLGWTMLGLCEYRTKKYRLALEHLLVGKALGVPRENQIGQVGRYHRAVLQTHFGRHEAALDELKKFTFPAVESPAIIQAIGVAALRMPLLPDELPSESRDIVLKTGRAVYDSWAAQSEDAEREYRELLVRYPENANIRFLYGSFLLQSDSQAGLRELRKCLELDPKYVPAMLQIAFEYLTRGEPAHGVSYAEDAARLQPDSFVPRNALGRLLVAAGDMQRGTAELEAAVKLAPDNPECRFALASAYTKTGRKGEAAKQKAEFLRLQRARDQASEK